MDDEPSTAADGAEALVLEAFRRARDSGKRDWDQMRTAVLKNRLLEITDHRFAETAWGASSFREFVDSLTSIVSVDTSTTPPTLTLLPDARGLIGERPTVAPPSERVRADLWHAILDYAAIDGWAWDSDAGAAVPAAEAGADAPVFPTITQDAMRGWRRQFLDAQADTAAFHDDPKVTRWVEGRGGAEQLPPSLRGQWFAFLKTEVVDRLTHWFNSHGIDLPPDITVTAPQQRRDGGEDQIREFVIACVREMSLGELRALPLPAGAMWRASRNR